MAEFPFLGDRAEPLSVAFNRIASKNPEFTAEHQGVKILGYFTHGPGIIFNTKKPITRVEDLQGLKFRIGGGMVNEISKQLDMNVTLKPAPESFELLSSGVMDGTLFPAESTDSFKIDKIIKHATQIPGGLYNTSFVFMMNPAKYNALSAQDKAVVDKLSGEYAARTFGEGWDKVDAASREVQKTQGVVRVQADPSFIQAVAAKQAELEDRWAAAAAAKVPVSDDEMDGKGGTAIDVDSLFVGFDGTGTAEEIKGRLRDKMADVEAFRKKSRLH